MDTTQLLKGVLDVAVLAVVEDEDGYGYDVLRRLRAGGLAEVGDASVYGTLRRLYAAGALTSYVVPSGDARWMPVDGREMPDSAAGGHSAQMLKSFRRSLNGDVAKSRSTIRRASASNFFSSAAM